MAFAPVKYNVQVLIHTVKHVHFFHMPLIQEAPGQRLALADWLPCSQLTDVSRAIDEF